VRVGPLYERRVRGHWSYAVQSPTQTCISTASVLFTVSSETRGRQFSKYLAIIKTFVDMSHESELKQ
jgi:hypothetical protein